MNTTKKIKNNIKDMDKILLFITLLLCGYGLLNIVTASSREAVTNLAQSEFYYFYRHIIILIGSLICSAIVLKISTKSYPKLIPILFVIILILNFYVMLKGSSTRGASNWIDLGFFKLQPSEIAKPIIIIYLSCVFEKYYKIFKNKGEKIWEGIGLIFIIGCISAIVVALQKDLGTSLIITGIFGVMYLSSPIPLKIKFKSLLILLGLILVAGLIFITNKNSLLTSAQESRLDYFDPCSKYETNGYQICNAFIAINRGGVFGVGIGKSSQKYSYIPEPHTDMVFSIIAEENGLLRCTLIFIVYIIILYRTLKIACSASTLRGRYICIGTATYIFLHIFINLGGLFGLIPLTGVPLPFLSYGGSFTLSLICMLTVVQKVQIETKNKKIQIN